MGRSHRHVELHCLNRLKKGKLRSRFSARPPSKRSLRPWHFFNRPRRRWHAWRPWR